MRQYRYYVRGVMWRYVWNYADPIKKPCTRGLEKRPATLSLDQPLGENGDYTLVDLVPAEVDDEAILLAGLHEALDQLPDVQRRVVLERFNGSKFTKIRAYRFLCKDFGLTAKATMALVDDALAFLRRELVGEVG